MVSSLREHATQIIFGSHTGLNTQEEGGCNTCEQGSNGSSDSALMVAVSACAAATKTIGKAVATGWRPMLKAAGHAWAAVKSAVRSTARVVQYQVQQALCVYASSYVSCIPKELDQNPGSSDVQNCCCDLGRAAHTGANTRGRAGLVVCSFHQNPLDNAWVTVDGKVGAAALSHSPC